MPDKVFDPKECTERHLCTGPLYFGKCASCGSNHCNFTPKPEPKKEGEKSNG